MNSATVKVWIDAARPKTLAAGLSPVLIGTALAVSDGVFHPWAMLAALLGALFIQIGTNYANDYFDFKKGADTEERIGPTRAVAAGLVSPNQMKNAFILAFGLAVLCGVYLVYRGGWPIVLIGLLSLLSGVLYTGGPRPLAYVGLGDIFAFVFFGPVAVAGTYYVQALEVPLIAIIAGFAPGFFSVALLCVNNLRDIASDTKAHKKTLAVRFGATFARVEFTGAIVLAMMIPVALVGFTQSHPFALLASLSMIPAVFVIKTVSTQEGPILNTALAKTGMLLLLYALLFSIGWVWG